MVGGLANRAVLVATTDQIIFVLGDFRGDVWMMDLAAGATTA